MSRRWEQTNKVKKILMNWGKRIEVQSRAQVLTSVQLTKALTPNYYWLTVSCCHYCALISLRSFIFSRSALMLFNWHIFKLQNSIVFLISFKCEINYLLSYLDFIGRLKMKCSFTSCKRKAGDLEENPSRKRLKTDVPTADPTRMTEADLSFRQNFAISQLFKKYKFIQSPRLPPKPEVSKSRLRGAAFSWFSRNPVLSAADHLDK